MFILLIIIGLVVFYFITLILKEDENQVDYSEHFQLNIDLYNTIYDCMEKAYSLSEDPTSLKKYMVFKREVLISSSAFEALEKYHTPDGFNMYISPAYIREYNLNYLIRDINTIRKALYQAHNFSEFQDNVGTLSSSFRLLTTSGISLEKIQEERITVVNEFQQ